MSVLHIVAAMAMKLPRYTISGSMRKICEGLLRILLVSYLLCPVLVVFGFYVTSDRVAVIEHVRDRTYIVGEDSEATHLNVAHKPVFTTAPQAIYGSKCVDIIRSTFCVLAIYWMVTTFFVWIPITAYLEGETLQIDNEQLELWDKE